MRKLIAIAALMASVAVSAEETPTQFMKRYVGFNAEDLARYQTAFEFPVVRFTGGVLEVLSDPAVPMANFENIKKTGWVASRIDAINALSESSEAALVEFSFSRMGVTGNAFFNSTGHYGLVSTDEG